MTNLGRLVKSLWPLIMALAVAACSVNPPVQEMSDARQAIQAAREAKADVHAPVRFGAAEQQLEKAKSALEDGAYDQARTHAVAAKQEAVRARDIAVHAFGPAE